MKKYLSIILLGCFVFSAIPVFADYPSGLSERSVRKLERAKNKAKKGNKEKLAAVCKSITPLKKALLKNAYPGHINRSDPRASGFAFVCGPDCPRSFPVSAYYSDGTAAFKLGYYGKWEGNGRPRAYCAAGGAPACSTSAVSSNSRKSGRDGKIYLVFDTKAKSCRSATPGARNGSPF